MEKNKRVVSLALEADQQQWLEDMASKYKLSDASKAARVLLDYARIDGDEAEIFEKIRCPRC